jgi:hypothetical protein
VEDLIETLTRGNVAAVKIALTSVVSALAIYQVFLMSVGYGKLRLPFLGARPASATHRAVGDTVVIVTFLIAFMCLSYFGWDDGGNGSDEGSNVHAVPGLLLIGVLTLKIIVVRWWHAMGRFLPALGISVFLLFVITWTTSALEFLA